MILSRIDLNPLHPNTYKLLADPYRLHQILCMCFESSRQESGVLYRVEPGPFLIIQSNAEANWTVFPDAATIFNTTPITKPFQPELVRGQRLSFRLRCRPCKKVKVEGYKNSRFRFLRKEFERADWLARQGETKGFNLERLSEIQDSWCDTKPAEEQQKTMTIASVRFDGVLVVTDPDKFMGALHAGIGPQKAYGFGLLSVARAVD